MRVVVLCAAALIGACGVGSAASGHAAVVEVEPPDGVTVPQAPDRVVVTFNEPVSTPGNTVRLIDPSGAAVAADVIVEGTRLTVTPLTTLSEGTHVLSWRVVSLDGHLVSAASHFSVGTATDTTTNHGSLHAEQLNGSATDRWRTLGHVALVIGAAGLYPLAQRRMVPAVAAAVALISGIVRTVRDAADLGGSAAWDVGDTRHALLLTMAAAMLTVVNVVPLRRPALWWRWGLGVGAVGVWASTGLVSGHALGLAAPWRWVLHPLHLAASLVWAGGVVAALLDTTQLRRVSRVVLWVVPTLLVVGAAQAWALDYRLGGDPWSNRLTLKLVVLLLALLTGLAVRRRLRNGTAPTTGTRRLVGFEALCLVSVAAVSASLGAVAPPHGTSDHRRHTVSDTVSDTVIIDIGFDDSPMRLTLEVPATAGRAATATVTLTSPNTSISAVQSLRLSISSDEAGVEPLTMLDTTMMSTEVTWRWPAPGTWSVEARIRPDRFTSLRASESVTVVR